MKRKLVITMVVIASITLTVGIVKAAGLTADWLRVGTQGEGGVTYFNGTIINDTTGDNDVNNPVTFGDNVRIDGRVYRGATAGTSDTLPFIVDDNMEVTGTLTVGGLSGDGVVGATNIVDGAVTSAKIAAESVTQAQEVTFEPGTTSATTTASGGNYDILDEMNITTGANTVFVMFSGYGTIDAINKSIRIGISLDGDVVDRTIRRGTNGEGEGQINLVTSALIDVAAGDHIIRLLWQTDDGQEATMYAHTLDVIELKK